MPLLQELYVGDKHIVADELDLAAELVGELLPVGPIALGAAVFDAHDRIFAAELDVKVDQLIAGDGLAGALLEGVSAVAVVELGRRDIQGEEDLLARLVAGVLDGLEDGLDGRLGALELRGKPAFVADRGGEALLLEHGLQGVEGLGDGAQALGEACRSPWA